MGDGEKELPRLVSTVTQADGQGGWVQRYIATTTSFDLFKRADQVASSLCIILKYIVENFVENLQRISFNISKAKTSKSQHEISSHDAFCPD